MRLVRTIGIALLAGILFLSSAHATAGGQRKSASVEQLQALFVQRLVKYVSWPAGVEPGSDKPFVVASTDAASLRPYFTDDRFKLVQWPVDDYHILVVNGVPSREAAAILKRADKQPVLTIGQTPANLRMGVVINFRMVNGRIKLQVNPDAADRAGLSISSKLLRIAQIYTGGGNE